jgi:DNA-binding Xre family transcriptional regulator
MACNWKLRAVLADKCGIGSATALKKRLEKSAGVKLSLQSVSVLLKKRPDAIRFQTIQALCNATDLKLSDFCEVLPEVLEPCFAPKSLYGRGQQSKPAGQGFPAPRDFYKPKRQERFVI